MELMRKTGFAHFPCQHVSHCSSCYLQRWTGRVVWLESLFTSDNCVKSWMFRRKYIITVYHRVSQMPSTKIDLDLATVQLYELHVKTSVFAQNSQSNCVQDDTTVSIKTVFWAQETCTWVYYAPGNSHLINLPLKGGYPDNSTYVMTPKLHISIW